MLFFHGNCYKSLFQKANKQLHDIQDWLTANKLSLNINKTCYIVFRTPNSRPPPNHMNILLNNNVVKRTDTTKFLGIIVHEHLSWKPHMELLLHKINIISGVVSKIKHYLTKEALLMLYNSLIKSHLQYCIMTWCFGNKTLVKKLQRAANKFIRLVFGLKYRDSVGNVMKHSSILTIEQILHLETAIFMHKLTNNSLPSAFCDILENNTIKSNTTRKTRSGSGLYPSFCRIDLTKQSLKYLGPLVWNRIPRDIKDHKSLNIFKNCLFNYILK